MLIVAVDAGNTRIKWGVWEAGWTRQDSVPTSQVEALGAEWNDLQPPDAIHASSVAAPRVREWLDAWARLRAIPVHWLSSRSEQCGVRNAYREPAQLGADRWASLIAAWHLIGAAAVVVNAGTAVTIDALSGQGVFRGGVILPGLTLMASALASGTAGLPRVQGAFVEFPDNTADAIETGAVHAVCGAIGRMRDVLASGGALPQLVLSGGAASAIEHRLEPPVLRVPYLVLEGLRIVADSGRAA
jgi:type III pantothenate kinase